MNIYNNIALGTWLFGGLRWGNVDSDISYRTMCEAIERGVGYLDTADAYGKGYSEVLIGQLPRSLKQKIKIMTKGGVVWNDDGTRKIDISQPHVLDALNRSLARLNVEQIEVYYLHEDDDTRTAEEVAETLDKILETGTVKHVGLSNFSDQRVEEISSYVPIYSVQNECNPLEVKDTIGSIKLIKNKGIQFHGYGLLSKGLLSGKFCGNEEFQSGDNRNENKEFTGNRFIQNIEKLKKLKQQMSHIGIPLAPLVISWAINYCKIDLAIIGCRNISQLNQILDNVDQVGNTAAINIMTDYFHTW